MSRSKAAEVLPHPEADALAARAVPRAMRLAGAVREGAWDVAQITDGLTRDELVALAVALAAMVDVDKSARQLLAWIDPPHESDWDEAALRKAHAAHYQGKRDAWVLAGEREYQRLRYLRRTGRAA